MVALRWGRLLGFSAERTQPQKQAQKKQKQKRSALAEHPSDFWLTPYPYGKGADVFVQYTLVLSDDTMAPK